MIKYIFCLSLLTAFSAFAQDFEVRLKLTNGHLRELIFGCAAGATAGYDRRIDDFAPPPGIETGYTVFLSADKNFPPFYKDMRNHGEKIIWQFYGKVYEGKPIQLQWQAGELPAEYNFEMYSQVADKRVDMKKQYSFEIAETQILTITATRSTAGREAEQDKKESGE